MVLSADVHTYSRASTVHEALKPITPLLCIMQAHAHTHAHSVHTALTAAVIAQDDAMSVVGGSPKHSPSNPPPTSPGGSAPTGSRRRGPPITVVNGSNNSLLNHDGGSSSSVPGRRGSYSASGSGSSGSAGSNPLMHPDYSIKICLTVSITTVYTILSTIWTALLA
jgi:hypothetical protein